MANFIKQIQVGTITYDINAVHADSAANATSAVNAELHEGKTVAEIVALAKTENSFAHFKVVTSLPTVDAADKNVIYLMASANGTGDAYDEYIVVGAGTTVDPYKWEKIGHTDIDLSNYVTKGSYKSGAASTTTSGKSTATTTEAGAATINTSEVDLGTATGTASITYSKAPTATGSAGATTTANTGSAGSHSHTFTGTAATISISSSGSAEAAGGHNHEVTPETASVIATVSGTTGSINAAPSATGSAGGHSHSITPSTISISSAPKATGSTGDHAHTVTVDSHTHGTNVTVATGVTGSDYVDAITAITPSTASVKPFGSAGSLPSLTVSNKTVYSSLTADTTYAEGDSELMKISVANNVLKLDPYVLGTTTVGSASGWKAGSLPSAGTAVTVLTGLGTPTTASFPKAVKVSATTSVAAPGAATTLTATCSTTGAHTHSISGTAKTVVSGITVTGSAGGHTHGITGVATTVVTDVTSTTADVLSSITLAAAASHTHTARVTGSTTYTPAGILDATGSHSHTYVELKSHSHSITSTSATATGTASVAIGKHTHSVTIANHSHTVNEHTHSISHTHNTTL